MAELSPMMQQYMKIKERNKDCLLFYRLGDFYEMFFDDAKVASKELDLVLTGRDCGQEERAPMCGVPFHSCDAYIARLVEKGYKIAICEQMEDPKTAKGIVKRDVIRVITPGTVIEDTILDESKNNYICSFYLNKRECGLCFADISTGSIYLTSFSGADVLQRAECELSRFQPKEVVYNKNIPLNAQIINFLNNKLSVIPSEKPEEYFDVQSAEKIICEHFSITSPEVISIDHNSSAALALGSLLSTLYETQLGGLEGLKNLNIYTDGQFMRLDYTALRNLELCESMRTGEKRGTLLWVLDKTKTSMGRRYLRRLIEQPLMSLTEINNRLNSVDELVSDTVLRGEMSELLSGIHDIERLLSRIVYGTATGRELRSLCNAIERLPELKSLLSSCHSKELKTIYDGMDELRDIYEIINNSIVDEPPVSIREGGIIREGYNEEVDLLRSDMTNGKGFIAKIEAEEKEKTGIKNLRVRYNKVFGYYIEVTNSALDKVPEEYIRKQTLTNCERFITDELKRLEARVLGAKERVTGLEFEIFDAVRQTVAQESVRLQETADVIAKLDVFCSLATVAVNNNYCRPNLNTKGILNITDGRHPVVEQMSSDAFVPNDTLLDKGDNRCAIITGPNMAGKSTYMRQVALITVMAQIGSFVPATSADVSVVDAVFTRVGASDDLASGRSTFMVEMSEVAEILKHATSNSLLILDEIGRGTSTYDGMSIARSVLEFVADKKRIGAKTLFATHYHELTTLEGQIKGIKNYNIAVKKRGDDITFLRRIVRGGADDSYGVEVAKLSGIPEVVIKRAKDILAQITADGTVAVFKEPEKTYEMQMSIADHESAMLIEELKVIDINTLTPVEALGVLNDIVKSAKKIN